MTPCVWRVGLYCIDNSTRHTSDERYSLDPMCDQTTIVIVKTTKDHRCCLFQKMDLVLRVSVIKGIAETDND
jgi:hypothetical protein